MSCTVVLGASRGIGARLAARLAADGHPVVALARRDPAEWEIAFEADRRSGDVSDGGVLRRALSDARKQHGAISSVVNCVGAFSSDLLTTATDARAQAVFAGNALVANTVMREASRALMRDRAGTVITLSSIASRIPMRGNALYGAAKAATEHLTAAYAREMSGAGVRFFALGISFVDDTTMVESLGDEFRSLYEQRLTAPRPVTISDLTTYLDFLCSDAGGLLNGQTLVLGSPV